MNIEQDINILKQLIREYKRKPETQNEFFIGLIEERAIETLLTAYEKEKELLELASNMLDNIDYDQIPIAIGELKSELEKEKEKNKKAYRKANNYLYFNDSADYEVALWEVIRTLRPDLAKKWDNGEDALLKYIEEE